MSMTDVSQNLPDKSELFVVLIAPNVSEQMGGEAIKSLQVYQELERQGVLAHQITHARCRPELEAKFPGMRVTYLPDTWVQKLAWRSVVFRELVRLIFMWRAARVARRLVKGKTNAVIHYTSPVSPVLPYFRTSGTGVVIGPLNGNIHHPPAFRSRERWADWFRRIIHPALQYGLRPMFSGKRAADVLLVSGGERSFESLRMAGCRDEQMRAEIDSGITERLREQPRVTHSGRNLRFVHNGRLVPHKGTDLVIKAVARTKLPIEVDVIGRGPTKAACEQLARDLKVADRVKFIEWVPDHSKLAEMLRTYRGFVFPSLAEANGIVVQEAMAMGLPTICANWGGPALLVKPEWGVLVEPNSEGDLINGLAKAMDELAEDGERAERMSQLGRERALAEGFFWPEIVARWIEIYRAVAGRHSATRESATV